MLITKKIRLELSEQDAATLEFMQAKCRGLYNWWVMKLRNGELWPGTLAAKKTLKESRKYDPELDDVYDKLLQKVFFRLGAAMDAFCRRVKDGEKQRDKCQKKSRRYKHLSNVYKCVSEKKRNKQRDSLHKASHLIGHKLVERTVVVGDLSQRQMVTKQHHEKNKARNRAVYNDWGLYTFTRMLTYKCQVYGKELVILDECNTSKMCSGCEHLQDMPLWKRTYKCPKCGLVMDCDENSAVNILTRYLARLGPHTPNEECGVLQEDGLDVASMELAQAG